MSNASPLPVESTVVCTVPVGVPADVAFNAILVFSRSPVSAALRVKYMLPPTVEDALALLAKGSMGSEKRSGEDAGDEKGNAALVLAIEAFVSPKNTCVWPGSLTACVCAAIAAP